MLFREFPQKWSVTAATVKPCPVSLQAPKVLGQQRGGLRSLPFPGPLGALGALGHLLQARKRSITGSIGTEYEVDPSMKTSPGELWLAHSVRSWGLWTLRRGAFQAVVGSAVVESTVHLGPVRGSHCKNLETKPGLQRGRLWIFRFVGEVAPWFSEHLSD